MKKKHLYSLLALVGIVVGTVFLIRTYRQKTFKKTATGLEYQVVRRGAGPSPQEGEMLLTNMTYKTDEGGVIFSTEDQELPLAIPYYKDKLREDGGFAEAISMLQKGDSLIFRLEAEKFFGENLAYMAAQHNLEKDTKILLHLHLQDIMTEEAYKKWETEQIAMLQEKQQEQAAKQLQEDSKAITNYLKAQQITATATASGLHYVIDKPGQGALPKSGSKVKVNYTGQILGGKVFDTSLAEIAKKHDIHNPQRTYEPIEFQLGVGQVIQGWDEGIMLLHKGAKARLFIPSTLAYGSQNVGGGLIPANSILMFEVELVDVQG